ncbi:MAG: hypothetical protein Q9225_001917 [Loekoesia sp. 1 TL-2023]
MSALGTKAPPDGDVDLRGHFMAGIIVMTVIAVSIAWLRLYTRAFVSRNLWWDDWTMFAASLITVVTNAFLINAYHLGLGRHVAYVPKKNIPETFKWLWAAEPTNLFAVTLVRFSIALFFLRLVPPKKRYIWTIWTTVGILAVSDIYISINFFFECRPIRRVWLPNTPGSCFSEEITQSALWLFQVASILTDIVLLCIPVGMFWRLQVDLRRRLGLIFLCGLGIFTCACAVVKTILLPNLLSTDPDKTWIVAELCLWAPLELCVGMICGSIPTLRPLVIFCRKKIFRSPGSYHSSRSTMKLDSYGHRVPKGSLVPKPQYSITKAQKGLMPSTSKEHMVSPHGEHGIVKRQDIEVSYKTAGSPGEASEPQCTGWRAV